MNILLVAAVPEQIGTLQNLWQLYSHDFTEFLPDDVDEQGLYRFDFDFEEYFEKQGRWPYLAMAGEHIAGFALFSDWVTRGSGKGRHMEEFFILRRYRGKGIGRSIAFQCFDTYAGYWEVSEVASNTPAIAFWRKVIGDYTNGKFEEITRKGRDTNIVLQMFNSAG